MSQRKSIPIEETINSVLSDHFDNAENPHQTIYKIWLVLNAATLATSLADTDSSVVFTTYN